MRRNHESFAAFVEFAESAVPVTETRCSLDTHNTAKAWTGSASKDEAIELARSGWAAGRELIAEYSAKFSAILGSRVSRPILSRSVAGFAPDVGSFLSGDPECMFSREMAHADAPGRVLSVVANGGASGGISPENIMQRGAMICALVDALENAGYSCQLTVAFHVTDGGEYSADVIPIKEAGEALELDRAAFVFAHPSMLRRLVFAARETDAAFIRQSGEGYGASMEVPSEEQGDLYFPRSYLGDASDATLLRWFRKQLAKVGIEISE